MPAIAGRLRLTSTIEAPSPQPVAFDAPLPVRRGVSVFQPVRDSETPPICHHGDPMSRPEAERRALQLEYATIGWNAGEAVFTITLGVIAGSLALIGFGTDSIIEICRENLADYKVPVRVEFMDAFPKTPTGKIQKSRISIQ